MTRASNLRTGGQILVDQLRIHGVELAFGVPGESYLGLLDALYDSAIRYIVCRQESGATMMAEAYGKLTGRPGIAMVTRGPGATNGAHGVHIGRPPRPGPDGRLRYGWDERLHLGRGRRLTVRYSTPSGEPCSITARFERYERGASTIRLTADDGTRALVATASVWDVADAAAAADA